MGFQENKGQTSSNVRFLSHGQGYELFLTPREAVLELRHSKPVDVRASKRAAALNVLRRGNNQAKISVVRMSLAGANPNPEIEGLNQLPGKTNYFVGNNPKNWRTNVPSYARVKYTQVYPGVDLAFYGNQRRLEYDFIVAPGADPKAIALDISGAKQLRIDPNGNLVMSVRDGTVELQRPVAYQDVNGERKEIAANYSLGANHRVSFSVAEYDRSKALIFDPVLNYSTYLGGSTSGDFATGIAVDGAGDAFVTGGTFSPTFPLSVSTIGFNTNAPDPGVTTNGAAYVSELDPTGSTELYFTYLGGSGGEFANGIALDATGVYVTGESFSTDFPTVNGYITSPVSNPNGTGFIAKLNPAVGGAPSLLYSSYVAGTNGVSGDAGNAIAVDSSQNAYITGITFSTGINTTGAFISAPPDATDGNAFLTRIDTTQAGAASLIYSTYLGGTGLNALNLTFADAGFGVAVASGNAYIVGTTASIDFPVTTQTANTTAAFQATPNAANTLGTVFLSEINTNSGAAAQLVYSTYLSGEGQDIGNAIALGPNNVTYLTGSTTSLQFPITPTSNPPIAFQTTGSTIGVAFVSLIDTTKNGASSLTYSTYLGGSGSDVGFGIKADSVGNAYVAGSTDSIVTGTKFPLTPGALQTTSATTQGNAFISEISPLGTGPADLKYSTLLGGSGDGVNPDSANGIALDATNNVYIAGQTASSDFPVYPNPGAFQTSLSGTTSSFVAKLTLQPTVVVTPTTLSFGTVLEGSTSIAQTVTITNNTGIVVPYTLTNLTGNTGDFAAVPGGTAPCGASLAANNTPCTISVTFTPSTAGAETTNLIVGYTPYGIQSSQTVVLTGTGTTLAFSVSPATFTFPTGQLVGTTSAPTTITVTNAGAALPFTTSSTDSTDFTIAPGGTTPCPASGGSFPANSSCTFTATFNPAATGALTTTFSVIAGTTQTVVLNGTGWDFSLSPATQTVTTAPGATISPAPTVTVTLLGGFPGPVNLACTGTIPKGSCSVPASVSTTGAVTVTITTAHSSAAPPSSLRFPPISRRQVVLIGFSVLLLFTLPFARRRRSKVGLVGALVMIIGLTACSGNSGTPAGSYNLTITGTSNGVSRPPAAITLTVT